MPYVLLYLQPPFLGPQEKYFAARRALSGRDLADNVGFDAEIDETFRAQ